MRVSSRYRYFLSFLFSFLGLSLPTHCRCRELLNLITRNVAYTVVRTPLDEGSARRRTLPDNTQLSQETDIHASGGIRNHNPSKRVAAYLRLWLRGQWDRPCGYMGIYRSVNLKFIGPCIILIVAKVDQLDVTCFIFSLFTAQHVSNVSTSIFRSLRLIVDLFYVLYCLSTWEKMGVQWRSSSALHRLQESLWFS